MKIRSRLLRYLIAGSAVTGLGIVLLFIFDHLLHIQYLISSSLAFIIALVAGFFTHKIWTFENDNYENGAHVKQFGGHSLLSGSNFILNLILMYFFVDKLFLGHIMAQILTSGLIAIQSFFIYNLKIFKKKI